jgi:predicted nucleic acid-binding protein
MSVYVVDASVAAKWFFEEAYSEDASRPLHAKYRLHAPDFLLLELDCLHLVLAMLVGGRTVTADRRFYNALSIAPFLNHLCWIADLS